MKRAGIAAPWLVAIFVMTSVTAAGAPSEPVLGSRVAPALTGIQKDRARAHNQNARNEKCRARVKARRERFRQRQAERRANFRARQLSLRKAFEAGQQARREKFTARMAAAKEAFGEKETSAARHQRFAANIKDKREKFRERQATRRERFREHQAARREGFKERQRQRVMTFRTRYANHRQAKNRAQIDPTELTRIEEEDDGMAIALENEERAAQLHEQEVEQKEGDEGF